MVKRNWKVNEDFFEKWTVDSAYCCGFLLGDGCVRKNEGGNYQLSLSLHKKDEIVLRYIRDKIAPDYPIGYYTGEQKSGKKTPFSRIKITNNRLCESLIKHGVIPNKTGKEILPPSIPVKYIVDFVRGLFDADGSITRTKYRFNIVCSNKSFLDLLRDIFSVGTVYTNHGCWSWEVAKRIDVMRMGKTIYYNKDIFYLKRKKEIFDIAPKPRLYYAFNEYKTMSDWLIDERCKVKRSCLYTRIRSHDMSFEEAISSDVKNNNYKKFDQERVLNKKLGKMIECPLDEYQILPLTLNY